MTPTQADKAAAFRALHERNSAFIIPNPWDAGSASLLAAAGFEALATTSAGFAFSTGHRDNEVGRDDMMRHLALVAAATDLPVSADLENGFGDSPDHVAETIRRAAAAGVVGGSIEDATGVDDHLIYDSGFAVERITAAAEAARSLPFAFTLTARAENFLVDRRDLPDTIRRLQAYAAAGADVVYAPGLTSADDIAAVVRSVEVPVNVLVGFAGINSTRDRLSALGVRRISVGSALSRAAYGALLEGAREMRERGSFTFGDKAISFSELSARLSASEMAAKDRRR